MFDKQNLSAKQDAFDVWKYEISFWWNEIVKTELRYCVTNSCLTECFRFVPAKNINANYIPTIFHYELKFNEPRKVNNATFWCAKIHTIPGENKSYHQSSNNLRPPIHWTRPHHNARHRRVNCVRRTDWHATQRMYNRIVCSTMNYAKCAKTISSHVNFAIKMQRISWVHGTASTVALAFNIHR